MRLILFITTVFLSVLPVYAQTEEEIAFVKEFYVDVQLISIVEDREYCGYFFRDSNGELRGTRPLRGKSDSCQLGSPPRSVEVFASYHTHAAFTPESINEIPSLQDLMGDINTRLDGYISTPGGRLWFSDYRAREVRQICGIGCLLQDPDFRPGRFYKERRRYSLEDLEWMMGD